TGVSLKRSIKILDLAAAAWISTPRAFNMGRVLRCRWSQEWCRTAFIFQKTSLDQYTVRVAVRPCGSMAERLTTISYSEGRRFDPCLGQYSIVFFAFFRSSNSPPPSTTPALTPLPSMYDVLFYFLLLKRASAAV